MSDQPAEPPDDGARWLAHEERARKIAIVVRRALLMICAALAKEFDLDSGKG